jgi:NhaA family Na+:H+ antiporter
LGFRLPNGVRKRDLLVIGVIAGTGFTVAIFVTGQAFVDHAVMEAAKMGAMFSIVAAMIGLVLGRLLGVRRCVR